MSALLATLLWLSSLSLVGVSFFLDRQMLSYYPWLFADVLSAPLLATVAAALSVGLYVSGRARRPIGSALLLALVLATIFLDQRVFMNGGDPLDSPTIIGDQSGTPFSPLGTVSWAVVLYAAWRGLGPKRVAPLALLKELVRPYPEDRRADVVAAALVAGAIATAGAIVSFRAIGPHVNQFGLASFPPGATIVEDQAAGQLPTVTATYNSLGYRDREPAPPDPAKRRVLVVGNAYVSGRGIASEDDMLTTQLRRSLQDKSPNRYDVVAAGFPSYAIYGDARAIEALADYVQPSVAVIPYSHAYDPCPFDAQTILDRDPPNPVLRRIVWVLRLRSYVHVRARYWFDRLDPAAQARVMVQVQRIVDELAQFTAARGIRLVFLHYTHADPPQRQLAASPGVVHIFIPQEMDNHGVDDQYWYGGDGHPRAAFNRRIGELLADRIVRLP